MTGIPEKICDNCRCPTLTTLNSTVCAGYRSRDKIIYTMLSCAIWQAAAVKWSVAEAIAYAKFVGVPMSRPTVIKFCAANKAGYQLMGDGTRWIILPDRFKALLRGECEQ